MVFPLERNEIGIRGDRCWSIYEINQKHKDWLGEKEWELKTNQIYKGEVNISKEQAFQIFGRNKNVFESREKAQEMCNWLNRELPDNVEVERAKVNE